MPNWTSLQLSPTHLGLFLLDRRTGGPLTRVPVYAEAAWTARTPQPPPDNRFYELVGSELWKLDEPCADDNACRTRTEAAFAAALPQLLTSRARSALLADGSRARELFRDAIAQLLESEQVASVNDIPAADLDAAVLDVLKIAADRHQLELVEPKDEVKTTTTFPLGLLATDHTGYLSFDLRRMPGEVMSSVLEAVEVLRQDPDATVPAAIWMYPLTPTMQRYDALRQRRFANDAVVMRLELEPFELPSIIRHLGVPALQNPSLTDWRLSPGSFAAQAGALLGDEGCEHLFPANLAPGASGKLCWIWPSECPIGYQVSRNSLTKPTFSRAATSALTGG